MSGVIKAAIQKAKALSRCLIGKHEWEMHYTDSYKCKHCPTFEDFPKEIYGKYNK